MDGFTISNSNKFLQTGNIKEATSSGASSLQLDPELKRSGSIEGKSFADTLKDAVTEVNQMQKNSDKAIQDLSTGRTDNIADVMVTAEKADIAMRVMVQVRNKIIDAYNEVMKMQV